MIVLLSVYLFLSPLYCNGVGGMEVSRFLVVPSDLVFTWTNHHRAFFNRGQSNPGLENLCFFNKNKYLTFAILFSKMNIRCSEPNAFSIRGI
jgi:hypothetical protein